MNTPRPLAYNGSRMKPASPLYASTFAHRANKAWAPLVRGPRGQVYVRGLGIPRFWGPGTARRFPHLGLPLLCLSLLALALSSCGYHTLGAASHLPADARTLAVPLFSTRTETYHTEVAVTGAVVRELAARTRLRVTPADSGNPDLVLRGTILQETASPLTFNASAQQSSSYLITLVLSVTLTDAAGKVLYQNPNYVFRQQYQSTSDLAVFFQENPAATDRLARDFARQLTADLLEGL